MEGASFISIVFIIYMIAVMWRIVSKSGDSGAKVLIPIYGMYVFYKAADSTGIFWGNFALTVCYFILSACINSRGFMAFLAIAYLIIELVMVISFCKNMAACFDKHGGFTVGLVLLSPIFLGILAFGSARHYNQPAEESFGSIPEP